MTMRESRIIVSDSLERTIEVGRNLALELKSGDILTLSGPLGAGKTCMIKGIALGLGINEDDVKSPSFTLVNEYYGRGLPLYHLDLYRMRDPRELYNIGWDDYFMRDGIMAVEWGEKAKDFLPEERIEIAIEILGDNSRKLCIEFRRQPEGLGT